MRDVPQATPSDCSPTSASTTDRPGRPEPLSSAQLARAAHNGKDPDADRTREAQAPLLGCA